MNFSPTTAILTATLASAVLTTVLVRLAVLLPDQPAMRWWSAAFAVNTLRFIAAIFLPGIDGQATVFAVESLNAINAILLFAGTMRFVAWEPALRALYTGRPLFAPDAPLLGPLTDWSSR